MQRSPAWFVGGGLFVLAAGSVFACDPGGAQSPHQMVKDTLDALTQSVVYSVKSVLAGQNDQITIVTQDCNINQVSGPTPIAGGNVTVSTVQVTMQPGDVIPWHFHPGTGFINITQGTFTLYHYYSPSQGGQGLVTQDYAAGSGFVEVPLDVHHGANNTSGVTVFYATFITPAGQPVRQYVADPSTVCNN